MTDKIYHFTLMYISDTFNHILSCFLINLTFWLCLRFQSRMFDVIHWMWFLFQHYLYVNHVRSKNWRLLHIRLGSNKACGILTWQEGWLLYLLNQRDVVQFTGKRLHETARRSNFKNSLIYIFKIKNIWIAFYHLQRHSHTYSRPNS